MARLRVWGPLPLSTPPFFFSPPKERKREGKSREREGTWKNEALPTSFRREKRTREEGVVYAV
jgi:hypothetical protein